MEKKMEIQHFTLDPSCQHFAVDKFNQNDSAYGIKWGMVVREYLQTVYADEKKQTEITVDGTIYRILKRDMVTVFYDFDGNTLFDVENQRLEKEYGWIMDECKAKEATENDEMDEQEVEGDDEKEADQEIEPAKAEGSREEQEKHGVVYSGHEGAVAKLKSELVLAKNKDFAKPIIEYLINRIDESESLAADIVQKHKTWDKCYDYIYSMARKQATGNSTAVRDDVVFEWAEDYYHKDDKAEAEKKAKEELEHKKQHKEREKKEKEEQKKRIERMNKRKEKTEITKDAPVAPEKKKEDKPVAEEKAVRSKSKKKEFDGQMDLFSMMDL